MESFKVDWFDTEDGAGGWTSASGTRDGVDGGGGGGAADSITVGNSSRQSAYTMRGR